MKHARDIWIFDEPTNDLDLETIGILEEELRNYKGALIIVGHDRSFINNVTDRCWVLHEGKLENFEGGFAQAEIFLEAIHLEAALKQKMPATAATATVLATPPANGRPPLSNKEKNRLEKLDGEVPQLEARVGQLKLALGSFDFTSMSAEKKQQLAQMQQELEREEKKLEGLLEEWLELEGRRE
jgi:ABC transport system ATP-binding/permease protein